VLRRARRGREATVSVGVTARSRPRTTALGRTRALSQGSGTPRDAFLAGSVVAGIVAVVALHVFFLVIFATMGP